MNANLPQLDLPRDYVVGNDITEAILNFYKQTCRLKAGIFALCAFIENPPAAFQIY